MEENKKVITISFVAAGVLAGFTIKLLMDFGASISSIFTRIQGTELLANGVPVGIGILTFAILQFNPKLNEWADGVVGELRKVVWPTRRDTGLMTVVVVITIAIATVILGSIDAVWAYLIKAVLS